MAGYGQRTASYENPFSDWDEDGYENAFEKDANKINSDPPSEIGSVSGKMQIEVVFSEDISYGDPDGIALSILFGTILNLDPTNYRVSRILGAGFYWTANFQKAMEGESRLSQNIERPLFFVFKYYDF